MLEAGDRFVFDVAHRPTAPAGRDRALIEVTVDDVPMRAIPVDGTALDRPAHLETRIVQHEPRGVRNVTVTMDDDVAQWVRVEAAKRGISVSRLLGDYVGSMMRQQASYEAARADFFSRGPRRLCADGQRLPTRDELHER